jgi:hypothetical protein
MNFKIFFFAVLVLSVQSSFGSDVKVLGRSFMHSCGYYSRTSAEFQVNYTNSNLKWGSRVYLISGLSGTQYAAQKIEWQNREEIEMKASEAFTWTVDLEKTVHERSSSPSFNEFVFVFKIVSDGGEINYDLGSDKPWSFYKTDIEREGLSCISGSQDLPKFKSLLIQRIQR